MHETETEPSKEDFRKLKDADLRPGTSRVIGQAFCDARNLIARGLVAVGITPNMLTIAGFLSSCAAAGCFFLGASYTHGAAEAAGQPPYMFIAAGLLILASACDMLDGAVARIGCLGSPLGSVLDSSIDRMSDAVIYIALIAHFMLLGNLTYCVLAAIALTNAFLISYVKARSETLIPKCDVGYWMRGERSAALLIAACAGTVPAVVWQQAVLPALTVQRRLVWTYQVLSAKAAGRPAPHDGPSVGPLGLLKPWRYPRGSVPYDLVTGTNIAFIIFSHHIHPIFGPGADPLRQLLISLPVPVAL